MAATWLQAPPATSGVGRVIQQHRQRRHLSQGCLARLAGLTHGAVSRIESGARGGDAETLHRIADALELGLVDRVVLLSEAGYIPFAIDELRAHLLIDWWHRDERETT